MMKVVCLTIDLESDYGYDYIDTYEAFKNTTLLESIIKRYGAIPTAFITRGVLEGDFPFVQRLQGFGAEFGVHIVTHFPVEARIAEIKEAREAYIRRFGHQPMGYRGPAGLITEKELRFLVENGFRFDSSIFPFRRPKFFDYSMMPTRPFFYNDLKLMEIPPTVLPGVRLPFSLSYLQFFRPLTYRLLIDLFGLPELIIFNLHLHDLFKSRSIEKLPLRWRMVYRWNYLVDPLKILEDCIIRLKRQGYGFLLMKDIYELVISGDIEYDTLSEEVWERWKLRNSLQEMKRHGMTSY